MRVGVPREIKVHEYRVGLVPASVGEFVRRGHEVLVETGAGAGAGFGDEQYERAGGRIVATPDEVFAAAELIVKVKEPVGAERALLRDGQILFTYLHLAPDRELTEALVASGATCIAYETVTDAGGGLPLLVPMSEVAGRMAPQVAAYCLEKERGGRGVLMGGVPGVPPAEVLILGGGTAGSNAAFVALGMGAAVTVVTRSASTLRALSARFGPALRTVVSTGEAIGELVVRADAAIGTVLVPGGETPKLVSADMVRGMKPGAVIVDVSIDQGGCFATSRATTHAEPTYMRDGVVHYCVANMPGAVPRTSTIALNNATLPFALSLADKGGRKALADDPHLRNGLNVFAGRITCEAVAAAQGRDHVPAEEALGL